MKQLYKGLVPLCIVLCVCLGLSAFALRTYWLYDRNDVEVINQLIEENNLDFSKLESKLYVFATYSSLTAK